MIPAELLQAKLADWRPVGAGRHHWSEHFSTAGWTMHLTADACDSLGCRLWELRLQAHSDTPHAPLSVWAQRIANQVSGLMEPLKLLEVDESRQEAILRSVAPSQHGQKRSFYELKLAGKGTASLQRFTVSPETGHQRQAVPFTLTHEVLAKLIADITA
jgi:hypothetical protein